MLVSPSRAHHNVVQCAVASGPSRRPAAASAVPPRPADLNKNSFGDIWCRFVSLSPLCTSAGRARPGAGSAIHGCHPDYLAGTRSGIRSAAAASRARYRGRAPPTPPRAQVLKVHPTLRRRRSARTRELAPRRRRPCHWGRRGRGARRTGARRGQGHQVPTSQGKTAKGVRPPQKLPPPPRA